VVAGYKGVDESEKINLSVPVGGVYLKGIPRKVPAALDCNVRDVSLVTELIVPMLVP
jgi:hypothetical protein